MAGEWKQTRLGDYIALKGGLSYRGAFVDKGDALLIGMGCVSHTERFLPQGGRWYGGDFTKAHLVEPGDLVIATRQQSDNMPILGFPAMIPNSLKGRDVIVATNLYKVENHSIISNRFLYWLLRGREYRKRILECAKGTTVRMLTKDAIEEFHFLCPPANERAAITSILDSLDDKIELNRRMNETLEAMVRALFKSWFVDFDPVRAKAEGRDPGLPTHVADLFPDSFEDSELGEIPRGWNVRSLSELTSYLSRGIGPSYVDDGGVYVLNQKCIRNRRVNFSESRRHDSTKRSVDGRELRALDILVNSTGVGTLGRVAQIWYLPETTIVDSHVTVVRAANDIDPWFLGVGLLQRERDIEDLGEGSTGQTELSRSRLGALTSLVPPVYLQDSFGKIDDNSGDLRNEEHPRLCFPRQGCSKPAT
jgi:type I restriction enzyme S subunit